MSEISYLDEESNMSGMFDFFKPKAKAYTSMPTISKGSQGEAVQQLQAQLGIATSGVFDSGTEAQVILFQRNNGLPANGVVDQPTWAKLLGEVYVSPEQQTQNQAATQATIAQAANSITGLISQFTTPPANQEQLLQAPVTNIPAPPEQTFPWGWMIGGLLAIAAVGGSIYYATRED